MAVQLHLNRSNVQLAQGSRSSTFYQPHDLFLSHSGAQKGFVKDLYTQLRTLYFNTFMDVSHHSLPPGEPFPPHIFRAAKSCSLALVVLSEEFVCSKWPMLELSTFLDTVASGSGIKLLPLFFKLSPADLKSERNLKKWRKLWKSLAAKQDARHPLDISKWTQALQTLCLYSGLLFDSSSEGEHAYIARVVMAISQVIAPAFKFDTTYLHGKERLCKIILEKFEEMERHRHGAMLASSSTASQPKNTCVLGLYGLPGSGKSTLCKCLVDHFKTLYGSNRTLYIEFRSNASHEDVVDILKELLDLTDFRSRVKLDKASDLEHVEHLLKVSHFPSCKVFLVVDNISETSWEAIHRILHMGVGQGSKIILVARTLDVIRQTLDSLELGFNWACRSIVAPTINEREATQIFLNTARLSYPDFLESLTSRQVETVKDIVRMCSFDDSNNDHEEIWLPLVMKAMGARLLKYERGDWEAWDNDSKSFWTRVKGYKRNLVVEELIGDNFKALNDHHQIMFLDIALFVLHFETSSEKVCTCLSMMHGFDTTMIRMMMQDLEIHGFLTRSQDLITSSQYCIMQMQDLEIHGVLSRSQDLLTSSQYCIKVHDVYMEFAKSIRNGPAKYLRTTVSWCWKYHEEGDVNIGSQLLMENQSLGAEGDVRALILELGEGWERVNLHGYSALKAVGLKNCKSLVVLALLGLSSFKLLEIVNCVNFWQLECNDASLLNVDQLRIVKPAPLELVERVEGHVLSECQEWKQVSCMPSTVINMFKRVMTCYRQPSSLEVGLLLASRMRSLQVLHLENTGSRCLELVGSSNWCQLGELVVIEPGLERFELSHLPNLTHFTFCSFPDVVKLFTDYGSKYLDYSRRISRHVLLGRGLLMGCPQLKHVIMQSSLRQLGSVPAGLVSYELSDMTGIELPDLSLSSDTLEELDLQCWEFLERINLDKGFTSLRFLKLVRCDNLLEVTSLGSLPSLRSLQVLGCKLIQKLIGFDSCNMLEELVLRFCPELTEIPCFSSLLNLEKLKVDRCRRVKARWFHRLCNLEKLRVCIVGVRGECSLSFRNCRSLEVLVVEHCYSSNGTDSIDGTLMLEDLDNLVNLSRLEIIGVGPSLDKIGQETPELGLSTLVRLPNNNNVEEGRLSTTCRSVQLQPHIAGMGLLLPALSTLGLRNLEVLHNIDGIEHLLAVEDVTFSDLKNLRSLHGIEHLVMVEVAVFFSLNNLRSLHGVEYLTNLRVLCVWRCPMLEEMPSVRTLLRVKRFEVQECARLKAVEGCEYMKQLEEVAFDKCESMECCPLPNPRSMEYFSRVSFTGCKFAMKAVEDIMAAWDEIPRALGKACFPVLVQQYSRSSGSAQERVAEHLVRLKDLRL